MPGVTMGQGASEGSRCSSSQASSNSMRLPRAVLKKLSCSVLLAECWRVGRRNGSMFGLVPFHISTPEKSTRADSRYRERSGAMVCRGDGLHRLRRAHRHVHRDKGRGTERFKRVIEAPLRVRDVRLMRTGRQSLNIHSPAHR